MTFRIVPWRDRAEWRQVRDWFYEPAKDDRRELAVSRVTAWQVRGRVPHAIVATALLTTALLREEAQVLSDLEARLLFSAAIVRFVNGLLDPAQQAIHALSMTQLARNIGLPEHYVELRHAATHDTLPTLGTLCDAAEGALDWLFVNYWNLDDVETEGSERVPDPDALTLLGRWHTLRKADPARMLTTGDQDPNVRESVQVLKELERLSQGQQCAAACAKHILEECRKAPDSCIHWRPVIDILAQGQPEFPHAFVTSMLDVMRTHDAGTGYIPDHALLGTDRRAAETDSLPLDLANLLLDWSMFLMSDQPERFEDNKELLRSLAVAKDQWSAQLILRMSTETSIDVSLPAKWRQLIITPKTALKSAAHGVDLVSEEACGGLWQKTSRTNALPIGFVA